MIARMLAVLLGTAALAACTADTPPPKSAGKAVRGPAAPAPLPPPLPGTELDRVIGKDARALLQLFGPASADTIEGPARRLQFGGKACILDTYLYPPESGRTPIVTFVAARTPEGRDAERNSCIAALRRS